VQRVVDEGLECRSAGRDGNGAMVEPSRAGLPLSIDPFDATGGQAAPRPTGFVEHVHRVPGQRQRTRTSSPGDAGADDSDVERFPG
jgi:hypothetical protein